MGLEDVGGGGEPEEAVVGVVLDQFEGDEGFAGAGGMDDGGLARFREHGTGGLVGGLIVWKE